MPTNRRPLRRDKRTRKITPEVISAYRRALNLHNDPKHCNHDACNHSRSFYEACFELESLLGRDGEAEKVIDTVGQDLGNPPTGIFEPFDRASWQEAITIRMEIEKQIKG
jgi:hypothetical protein